MSYFNWKEHEHGEERQLYHKVGLESSNGAYGNDAYLTFFTHQFAFEVGWADRGSVLMIGTKVLIINSASIRENILNILRRHDVSFFIHENVLKICPDFRH